MLTSCTCCPSEPLRNSTVSWKLSPVLVFASSTFAYASIRFSSNLILWKYPFSGLLHLFLLSGSNFSGSLSSGFLLFSSIHNGYVVPYMNYQIFIFYRPTLESESSKYTSWAPLRLASIRALRVTMASLIPNRFCVLRKRSHALFKLGGDYSRGQANPSNFVAPDWDFLRDFWAQIRTQEVSRSPNLLRTDFSHDFLFGQIFDPIFWKNFHDFWGFG